MSMKYWSIGTIITGIILICIAAFHVQTPFDTFAKDSFDGTAQTIVFLVMIGAGIILLYLGALMYMMLSELLSLPKIPKEIEQKLAGIESKGIVESAVEKINKAVYYSFVAFAAIMTGAIGGTFVGYEDINYVFVFGIFLVFDGTYQVLHKDGDKVTDKPKKQAKKA